MRLRTGFLRLWVVLSLAWVALVGVHGYSAWSSLGPWVYYERPRGFVFFPAISESERETKELFARASHEPGDEQRVAESLQRHERVTVRSHLEWGLGPPLVLLIGGAAFWWIAAGFRGGPPKRPTE